MNRLLATMACDVRLQARNGFYWAVAFLLTGWAILVARLPGIDWGPLMPPILLGNLVMATFYFMGGLVLLEKGEGTLEAQVVTPLGPGEYLASKVITLSGLSVAESLLAVLVAVGIGFGWLPLVAGAALASVLYCLVGFAVVSRYDSINEYLFPTMLYTTVFFLPLLDYVGLWTSPLIYLHPFQAPLVLMKAAFLPIAPWEWLYGLLYPLLWIGLAYRWCRAAFRHFVVAAVGAPR